MRLVTYQSEGGPRLGVLREENVVRVLGMDMLALIEAGESGLIAARAASAARRGSPLADLTLTAPITQLRRNVFCVGVNYLAHAMESANARGVPFAKPERPVFFTKATTALNDPFGDIPFDAQVSTQMDWEAELGVVIGKTGKNIPAAQAMDYVFGYTVINDFTARDIQNAHGGQFFKGKSLDGTCPMGPWFVTKDDLPNPHQLRVLCRVNGVVKQDASTADFIFDIPNVIAGLSQGMTLLPGDIIATGTPSGVGFARTPPEFLKPGDVVETEVEGLGVLRNRIVD